MHGESVSRGRETKFTDGLATIDPDMKSHDLDFDYLFLLEALEGGVVPADEHVQTLLGMGLVERTPDGLALTHGSPRQARQSPLAAAGSISLSYG